MANQTLETRMVDLAKAVGAEIKINRNAIGGLGSLSTAAKGNLVAAINELLAKASANASAIGNNGALTTTAKDSLVAALNELHAQVKAIDVTSVIDDTKTGAANKTYSVNKILDLLAVQKAAIVDQISGGITDTTMDTLAEIAAFLKGDAAGGMVDALGKRVRVDAAQSFSEEQKAQGRSNIGAASASDLSALQTSAAATKTALDALSANIGNPTVDLVASFNAALA
jgi:hypothetical protein